MGLTVQQGSLLTRSVRVPYCRVRVFLYLLTVVVGLVTLAVAFYANKITEIRTGYGGGAKLVISMPGSPAGRKNCSLYDNTCLNNKSSEADGTETWSPSGSASHNVWCSGQITGLGWAQNTSHKPYPQFIPVGSHKYTEKRYFLTAVVMVRIYAKDISNFKTRELVQWLQYLSYAGVEHVYVYDAYLYKNESQRQPLHCFIKNGFVTYVDWSHKAILDITKRDKATQLPAYQDCLNRFGRQFAWQTAIDIDEYPYCPKDRAPGFLGRFLKEMIHEKNRKIGQIFMQNYLFLGRPLNASEHPLFIDRLWRRTTKRWNFSTRKPIFLSRAVREVRVHSNALRKGYVEYYPVHWRIRMHHYHGTRHQRFGEDPPEIVTKEDKGMMTAVSALEPCLTGCTLGCC